MKFKIFVYGICIVLFLSGLNGFGKNTRNTISNDILDDGLRIISQSQSPSMNSYSNYAPSGMPDFDQCQDSWQKIDVGANGNLESTASGDDLVVANTCIAPGNNAQLESSASGDDEVKWYFCGPTAAADVLWYLDSKHEKNDYPDNNQDTCDLVKKYTGISDDHVAGNVPKLIEDLAVSWIGTSSKCTTSVRDIANGVWNFINNSKLKNQYKVIVYDSHKITLDNLSSWMSFSGTIILRLDTPEGGHFVALQAVNTATNQITISDPYYDASSPSSSHTQHNNASIVSHDTYTVNTANLRVLSYPNDPCFITHAIDIWKKPVVTAIYAYPHTTVDIGANMHEVFYIMDVEQSTNDCTVYYYLSDGIEYAGGATVNGVPTEPIVEENTLKWFLPGLNPGQQYEVEFQIAVVNPQELEYMRVVRVWLSATSTDTEFYDDEFGILEINDENPPLITNIHHTISDDTLLIKCKVQDDMKVDQVKAYIINPEHQTSSYPMIKQTDDTYGVSLGITGWMTGEYIYHIWAKDIAGNEQTSEDHHFVISEELFVDADGPYSGKAGEQIQFYGSAAGGKQPYTWEWDFGDDQTSTEQNPLHQYDESGTYTVTLTVTDDNGDTSSDTTIATISEANRPPETPTISGPTRGRPDVSYEYTISTTDPDGDNIYYWIKWYDGDIGSGWYGPYPSGEPTKFNHSWSEKGTHTISVTAKDEYNAISETGTLKVTIPRNRIIQNSFLIQFLQKFFRTFDFIEKSSQI